MTIEGGLRLSLRALKKVLGENFNVERIDAAYINTTDKKFRKLTKSRIEKIVSELKDDKKPAKK